MNRKILRTIFFPFSGLFGMITSVRNWMFDQNILKSTEFQIPIISVGNLAVGGTGKTPHVEYILDILKNEGIKAAMLSRGYKRKTKGFILANESDNAETIGDEPFQVFNKFKNTIVAVDNKRVDGVSNLLKKYDDLEIVVLDDAFQHRYIKPGLSILLTSHSKLFYTDTLLPSGSLREKSSGSQRADIIIVTKCPKNLKPIDFRLLTTSINPLAYQSVFFTSIKYDELFPLFDSTRNEKCTYSKLKTDKMSVVLVTGIASSEQLKANINKYTTSIEQISFNDHHSFNTNDFLKIELIINKVDKKKKIIIVTEKDAARIISNPNYPDYLKPITFVAPIRVSFLRGQEAAFNTKIIHYVTKNSRNS